MTVVRAILAGFFSLTLCVSASDQVPVQRRPPKLPPLVAAPLYGVLVFGANSSHPVWAVFDKSDKALAHYDVLYLDLNADGDLTPAGERFSGVAKDGGSDASVRFELPLLK